MVLKVIMLVVFFAIMLGVGFYSRKERVIKKQMKKRGTL